MTLSGLHAGRLGSCPRAGTGPQEISSLKMLSEDNGLGVMCSPLLAVPMEGGTQRSGSGGRAALSGVETERREVSPPDDLCTAGVAGRPQRRRNETAR